MIQDLHYSFQEREKKKKKKNVGGIDVRRQLRWATVPSDDQHIS